MAAKELEITRVVKWVTPMFGNRHTIPYGTLEVTDGITTKMCNTKGDTLDDCDRYGGQYITFDRKPYLLNFYVENGKKKMRLIPIK